MNDQLLNLIVSVFVSFVTGILTVIFALGKYKEKVDHLEENTRVMGADIKHLLKELVACSTKLEERTKSYSSTLVKSESPLSLSSEGSNLLKRSGADAFVLKNQAELVDKIKQRKPQTAYDVQTIAREVVENLKDDERFVGFKNFVYQEGLDLDVIFIVMGIYLRDIALPLLNFKHEDIDLTAPATKS